MSFPAGLTALCCCLAFHCAAAAAPVAAAAAEAPHEHGIARLKVAVTGDVLELRLRMPLQTLLGFETAPRNQKQRQEVGRMAAKLRQPDMLFVPTPQAQCTAAGVVLTSDAIAPSFLAPDAAAAPAMPASRAGREPAAPTHPDLEALITYRCGNARLLTGLQVRMFEAFPALRQIDVAIATPRGQSGARLSPNRAGLTW